MLIKLSTLRSLYVAQAYL